MTKFTVLPNRETAIATNEVVAIIVQRDEQKDASKPDTFSVVGITKDSLKFFIYTNIPSYQQALTLEDEAIGLFDETYKSPMPKIDPRIVQRLAEKIRAEVEAEYEGALNKRNQKMFVEEDEEEIPENDLIEEEFEEEIPENDLIEEESDNSESTVEEMWNPDEEEKIVEQKPKNVKMPQKVTKTQPVVNYDDDGAE